MESFFAFFRRIWMSGLTNQLVRAILIAAVFELLVWLINRWIQRTLGPVLVRDVGADPSARVRRRRLLLGVPTLLVRAVLYLIALLMILRVFGLDTDAELLPVGIALVALALVAGHAALRDVLSGYLILYDHLYAEGDEIVLGDTEGIVDQIALRATRLRTADGELISIPHRQVGVVVNRSRGKEQA